MRTLQRGSALIVATIVVLIIAVIGVGMVRFTQRETAAATAGLRGDALSACAEAARKLLEAKFHGLGTHPTSIEVLDVKMDGPAGRLRAVGGHIDGDPSQPVVTVKQVEPLPPTAVVTPRPTRDLSNVIFKYQLGGQPLKVMVHCQEGDLSSPTSGRQMEIEYGINFGL